VSSSIPRDPERDPAPAPGPTDPPDPSDDADVEGHSSLLDAQFGQQIAANRAREAAEWARGENARRNAQKERKDKKGRLFGR
jgi:hypothetical protein